MYSEFPSFTEYLLRKISDLEQPTLGVGRKVQVRSLKAYQPTKYLGRTGAVAWINHRDGISEYVVDLSGGETEKFERHQLRADLKK